MKKTLRAALILLLTPSSSFAYMDMPTVSSALPAMLYSGLIFIGLEMYVLSKRLNATKHELLKVIGSVYVCTIIFMIAFSWAGMGLHHLLQKLLGRPLGAYVGLYDPSPWDKIYTATIGCFSLPDTEHVVVAGVALLSFLIPVFIVSGVMERGMLRKNKAVEHDVRSTVTKLKFVEFIVSWVGSFYYFFKIYN